MHFFSFRRNVLCCILHNAFLRNAGQHYSFYVTYKMFLRNREAAFRFSCSRLLLIILNNLSQRGFRKWSLYFKINFVRNPDVCGLLLLMISPQESREWRLFSLNAFFIGVLRKRINDYRVSCKNPAGTKGKKWR